MTGLIEYGRDRLLFFDKMLVTSAILINLTSMGLGREADELNFPNLKQSFIDSGWIELSTVERTVTTVERSDSKRADFDKPEGHSFMPYMNFLSGFWDMRVPVDGTGDSPFVEAGFTVIMLVAPGWFVTAGGGAGGPVIVVTAAAALTSSLRESTMANRAVTCSSFCARKQQKQ